MGKDYDKYFINFCFVLGKFVVVEFVEEILVDFVKIVNFEYYLLNFKEFELLGSLIYFIDIWFLLGKFVVVNVKYV